MVAYFEPLAAELCITLAVPDHIGRMGLLPTSFDAATSTLTVPGLDPRVQMEVIDASGRIIPVLRLGERVLLSGTAPGAYAVRIWSGEGMRHARFLKP